MTEAQIKHMVSRFLGWKLPANFSPDAGISFKAEFNESTPWPMKHEPTGTNLFDADQATAMVRYMIEGVPSMAETEADLRETLRAVLHHFGPEGANKVTRHVLMARSARADNKLIDEIEDAIAAES